MPHDHFHLSTSLTFAVACLLAAGCPGHQLVRPLCRREPALT
jgi:hypothetical protein